ncbi:hypothetical protein Efla_001127 [Eimeria flavescens]
MPTALEDRDMHELEEFGKGDKGTAQVQEPKGQRPSAVVDEPLPEATQANVRSTSIIAVPPPSAAAHSLTLTCPWNARASTSSFYLSGVWCTQHIQELKDTADLQRGTLGPAPTVGTQEWEKALLGCPTYGAAAAQTGAHSPRSLKLAAETRDEACPNRVCRWSYRYLQIANTTPSVWWWMA